MDKLTEIRSKIQDIIKNIDKIKGDFKVTTIQLLEILSEECIMNKDQFLYLKKELTIAKKELEEGLSKFSEGGHVFDDFPLACFEFDVCKQDLEICINQTNSIIEKFDDELKTVSYLLNLLK